MHTVHLYEMLVLRVAGDNTKLHTCDTHTRFINSVQTRCIVKGEAQKSPLFWRFSGGF